MCARSRTGFVVIFSNCPLLWVSKLQTDIAISTLHSEYVVLSRSVRPLLPLKTHINKVIDNLGIDSDNLKFVSSFTIYEDNNGDIVVATLPMTNPTPKHIAVKYHWWVGGKPITILHPCGFQDFVDQSSLTKLKSTIIQCLDMNT